MLNLALTHEGFGALLDELRGMTRRSRDLRQGWRLVQKEFIARRKQDFASEGASTAGGRWRPLKASRARGKLLQRTLRLKRSLTSPRHPDHVYIATPTELVLGTRVPYARFHQTGTRHMEPRPPVDPRPEEFDAYGRLLLGWIVEGRARQGRRAAEEAEA